MFRRQTFLSLYLDTNHAVIADNGTIVNSDGQIIAYVNNYGTVVNVGADDCGKDLEWLRTIL